MATLAGETFAGETVDTANPFGGVANLSATDAAIVVQLNVA
jgi:hypothetical protein